MSSFKEIEWSLLPVPVPENVSGYLPEVQESIFTYLSQMDDLNRKAYLIAKEHLGTSFHILRSTGYNEWVKSKPKN
jgi:hypothetical protein